MELILENVRCFAGEHRIPIRPLTFLVGENSSGKSTVLAGLSLLPKLITRSVSPDFNSPPFELGNYETIATYKGGRGGRARSFRIGFSDGTADKPAEGIIDFVNTGGEPRADSLSFRNGLSTVSLSLAEGKVVLQSDDISMTPLVAEGMASAFGDLRGAGLIHLLQMAYSRIYVQKDSFRPSNYARDYLGRVYELAGSEALSLAPVRTKPKRTYDELRYDPVAEGDHAPYVLARLLSNGGKDSPESRALIAFGKESGLFKQIEPRLFGKGASDPFQVMVKGEGAAANLVDVGYGVSQVLPILVDSLPGKEKGTARRQLLIQQPEVHLHPRAQAALGTYFCNVRKISKRTEFVVETHSDYIVDRVRQHVARGDVPPEDVLLLYFEKHGAEALVHEISIDRAGSIIGAPEGYRQFFLDEDLRLLTKGG